MKNYLEYNFITRFDDVGATRTMMPHNVVETFQLCSNNHSDILGVGVEDIRKSCNGKWVVLKAKFEFDRFPAINEPLTVSTWPLQTRMLFPRCFELKQNGVSLIRGRMEYGVINEETNRLVLPKYVGELGINEFLPSNMHDDTYTNATCEFANNDLVYTKIIRLSELDYNQHGNNIAYIKMAIDCFSFDEYSKLNIKVLEMYYSNQCFEGDQIHLYKKYVDDKCIIEGKTDKDTIFRAVFILKK
ncbi:MAG: hypothetical protein IJ358_04380 [Clostridia bacterium]|nr:hypothetical protein [Clostridia bacterium]